MPLHIQETKGNIVVVTASGKLGDEDYHDFVPQMEMLMERWGRIRMLFDTRDFDGWDLHSAWDEFKFELKHMHQVKRVAVIGEKTWERWAAKISGFFTGTEVRYFDRTESNEARAWIESGW